MGRKVDPSTQSKKQLSKMKADLQQSLGSTMHANHQLIHTPLLSHIQFCSIIFFFPLSSFFNDAGDSAHILKKMLERLVFVQGMLPLVCSIACELSLITRTQFCSIKNLVVASNKHCQILKTKEGRLYYCF